MKILTKIYIGFLLTFITLNEVIAQEGPSRPTNGGGSVAAPEMDSSMAVLGLGLAVGLAALISEHRRK